MTQPALNILPSEEKSKAVMFPTTYTFAQMQSTEQTEFIDDLTENVDNNIHKGMDNFPMDIFNRMLGYSLDNGKFRNVMLMVCMANWGMRYSDLVRVRYGYIFDRYGTLKEGFSLPDGEKKTRKSVIYYNNKATELAIGLYLKQPMNKTKARYDYLFTSDSGNATRATVQQIEADDLYNGKIDRLQKTLAKIPETKKRLLKKSAEGKISDNMLNEMLDDITAEKSKLESQLTDVIEMKKNYVSKTPNAGNMYIQRPLTHTAGEDIIKNTLREIGINPRNSKGKTNTNNKYNTHSLRKTFADCFIKTGDELVESGKLAFNDTILDLLKEKFKHSSKSVTTHYTNAQEEAFKTICQNLNIGLNILQKYVANGNNL